MNVQLARAAGARKRLVAWTKVISAMGDMREALDHRTWRADPLDVHLEHDCRAWAELACALADYISGLPKQ